MRAVLGQGLKEISILNSSDFGLTPLHITGFLILQVFSINHRFSDIWFLPISQGRYFDFPNVLEIFTVFLMSLGPAYRITAGHPPFLRKNIPE